MLGRCFICFLMMAWPFHSVTAQNLVSNPGFESGSNDWFTLGATFVNSSTNHSGTNAAAVTFVEEFGRFSQSMLGIVQPGQTYRWSAWMRRVPFAFGYNRADIRFRYTDAQGDHSVFVARIGVTDYWQQFTGEFSFNNIGTVTDASINIELFEPDLFFIDDVSIINISPTLFIHCTNGFVSLTWPTNESHPYGDTFDIYSLQSTTNLFPAAWNNVIDSPQTIGSNLTVTLPATNPSQFFRLIKP